MKELRKVAGVAPRLRRDFEGVRDVKDQTHYASGRVCDFANNLTKDYDFQLCILVNVSSMLAR